MLLAGSQLAPNVLKAILDGFPHFQVITSVTLQPLQTYLAISMSSILQFLVPVRKTGCIAPALLIHKVNFLLNIIITIYFFYFSPLRFQSSLHKTLLRKSFYYQYVAECFKIYFRPLSTFATGYF